MTAPAPFYIRHPDESLQDFISHIRAAGRLPELSEPPRHDPLRGDAAILAVFDDVTLLRVQDVVERTGKTYTIVRRAIYRAYHRGLLERHGHDGYRLRGAS